MHCPFGLSIHGGFIFFPFKHRYGHSVDRQMFPMDLGPLRIFHTQELKESSVFITLSSFPKFISIYGTVFLF